MRRISTKLTLAAGVAIALVMSVNGVTRVQRERELLEDDVRRDHLGLGRALAETTGALIERAGPAEALMAVEEANARRNRLSIRWVTSPARTGESCEIVERDGELFLETFVPVPTTAGTMGALSLVESLAPHTEYLRESVLRVILSALLTWLACAGAVHLAGLWLLARPLAPILSTMRRIGAGETVAPLALDRSDELGEVARQLDDMAARLNELQSSAAMAADSRIAAIEQLRHAERLSTVGKLAAGLAHELGTPLNVVSARGKMIQRGESEGDEVLDDARVIVDQADRMTAIIRQLLDFARSGRATREPTALRAQAQNVLSMLRKLANTGGVQLVLEDGEEVVASVDHGKMQQMLSNLVMNAIQAQPDGGAVNVSIEARAERVRVVVADRGAGMSQDVRERIFEPFFTTKDVGAGTGLGLSVVYGIVEEHGGTIAVESEPGQGTRFVVELPIGEVS